MGAIVYTMPEQVTNAPKIFDNVVVIIPTFDNWTVCFQCLDCLDVQTNSQFSVVLADDGSSSSPPASLAKYDFVTYLPLSHSGFAATCNRAAKKALSIGASHLLFLNDDTIFGCHFMESWCQEIQQHPNDIHGPMIYEYLRQQHVWASGGWQSVLLPFITIRRHYRQRTRVDILTACAIVIPREAWIRLAGFDEGYNTYYEDFDLLLRAKKLGIPTFIQPLSELSVYHIGACTSGRDGLWPREYQMIRSRIRFIRKHYAGLDRFLCLALVIPQLFLKTFFYLPSLPDLRRLGKALRAGFNQ